MFNSFAFVIHVLVHVCVVLITVLVKMMTVLVPIHVGKVYDVMMLIFFGKKYLLY